MRIVFLDRDGVINRYPGDNDYVKNWREFHFLPRVKAALKRLKSLGYKIYVISNQAGVSKGIFTKEKLDLITKNMLSELDKIGAKIDGVFYCIHREEDNCSCRKPKAGLIDRVNLHFNRDKSFFIGDTIRDIQAGRTAGLKTILVLSGKEKLTNQRRWAASPDFIARDLAQAVDTIITNKK